MKIGFMGLGQMGRSMAARLLEVGHEMIVHNRTPAAAEPLRARGARVAAVPAELFDADVVISMLADDAAVEAAWIASGLLERMPRGHLHLNMATVSLRMGKRLAELHGAAGADYVSAPVFGRPWVAAQGQLDIVIGGPAAARARCEPVFAALAKTQFVAGEEPFKANIVKIARNYLLASVVESFGEALALVRKSGVDPVAFYELMTTTSFSGPSYRNYGKLMVERKFDGPAAFTLRLGLKDVELALAAGGETQVPLPLAGILREQHLGAINAGFGDKDWASLADYIAERAGLK
jgi:3-hydroxyisobutyrate dehydrogenase-like beta-hydroxyacid dehydrogenase